MNKFVANIQKRPNLVHSGQKGLFNPGLMPGPFLHMFKFATEFSRNLRFSVDKHVNF